MCSCAASSAEASDPVGVTRSRAERGRLAMTAEQLSRPTIERDCLSAHCSSLSRGHFPTDMCRDSASGRSNSILSFGSSATERRDRSTASQRRPRFIAQCFRRQRRTSLASQTGVALSRATGRGKSGRAVQRPACAREVSRISATSASPARSSLRLRGIRLRCIHHECPGGAATPRGRRRRD